MLFAVSAEFVKQTFVKCQDIRSQWQGTLNFYGLTTKSLFADLINHKFLLLLRFRSDAPLCLIHTL